jgi:hypothetical protein
MKKYICTNLLLTFAVLIGGTNVASAETPTPHPSEFLATLQFDGTDWLDSGEQTFPQAFNFQSYDENIEHNKENVVEFQIGKSIVGTGSTGLESRGPNDQRPAVYFHRATKGEYDVYQYWLYYADNDWINNHEHDWEKYFVYVKNGKPTHLLISNHNSVKMKPWSEIPKDGNHPLIGVDGGSHAMKWQSEDGVQIRYNGEISKNNGRLDNGDNSTQQWVIYSNDKFEGVQAYVAKPDVFYYGDPDYAFSDEYKDPREAPWKRIEWDNPPLP